MEFDVRNKTILFISKRNSGKTVLMCHIVKLYKNEFDEIFLISPTEIMTKSFRDVVKPENIFSDYSEQWVERLMSKMLNLNKDKPEEEKKHVLLILDDCACDTNLHSSKTFKQLFVKGRHYNITTFVSAQYLNLMPPVVRNNADYVFAGQLNKNSQQILLQEYQAGDISNDEFLKMYRKFTTDHSFLVINCNSIKDNDDINQIYGSFKVDLK